MCKSEESEDKELMTMTQPTSLMKTVTFDLPESTMELLDKFVDETDKQVNGESCQVQTAAYQNDEADKCLVHMAWLRKTTDNVYMSN